MGLADYLNAFGVPSAQTQGQINQAAMSSSAPMMSQMSPDQVAAIQAPPPMPARAPAQVKVAPPKTSQAFQSYMAPKEAQPLSAYEQASQHSLADQQAQLSGLNQYINDLAKKPRGVDYSALAAYVDSTTGSKLAPAIEKLAPMSEDERDKMLFGLKHQLAQGQAQLSQNQLKNQQEEIQNRLANRREDNTELFRRQEIANAQERIAQAAAVGGPGGAMASTREKLGAEQQWLSNTTLNQYTPRLDGALKILKLMDAGQRGEFQTNQPLLGQLNAEIARLETGSQSPGLHASAKTEMEQTAAQLRNYVDKVRGGVTGADLTAQFNQARGMVNDLKGSYVDQIRAKHEEIAAGATPAQAPIFEAKRKAFEDSLARRSQGIDLGTNNDGSPRGGPPAIGDVKKGYRYKGGELHDPASWEKVN